MEARTQHNRFKGLPWFPEKDIIVLIGGAGGIGSWVTFLLARAGFKPIVYDFDTLEEDNLSGQLYPKRLIGQSKVAALTKICKEFSDEEILTMNEKIDEKSPTHTYVIAAFDNMKARRDMFDSWYNEHDKNSIFIDGRLEAEHFFIYCVTAENTDKYMKVLEEGTDDNIPDASCTEKQTSHMAAGIAWAIVSFFTNHITNVMIGEKVRTVPFRFECFMPLAMLGVPVDEEVEEIIGPTLEEEEQIEAWIDYSKSTGEEGVAYG